MMNFLFICAFMLLMDNQSGEWAVFKHEQKDVFIDLEDGVFTLLKDVDFAALIREDRDR